MWAVIKALLLAGLITVGIFWITSLVILLIPIIIFLVIFGFIALIAYGIITSQ